MNQPLTNPCVNNQLPLSPQRSPQNLAPRLSPQPHANSHPNYISTYDSRLAMASPPLKNYQQQPIMNKNTTNMPPHLGYPPSHPLSLNHSTVYLQNLSPLPSAVINQSSSSYNINQEFLVSPANYPSSVAHVHHPPTLVNQNQNRKMNLKKSNEIYIEKSLIKVNENIGIFLLLLFD